MSKITTHVLDTSRGCPAASISIQLDWQAGDGAWKRLGSGQSDADGRLKTLLGDDAEISAGIYRITFDTGAYFANLKLKSFYPEVVIFFEIGDPSQHYHVPLLLSPFGYSTYRGS